jgi:hypothetical protein
MRLLCRAAMGMFLIFAIIGLRTLGGKMWSCNDPNVSYRWQCVGEFLNEARLWLMAGNTLPHLWQKCSNW